MTLDGLLAIIGIIVAVYALARPIQHQSIGLLVPFWIVPSTVILSAGILLVMEGFSAWNVPLNPLLAFLMRFVAFASPVGGAILAVLLWRAARISARSDWRFGEFLLTSLREGTFDEVVRILLKNRDRLAEVLSPDTADLVFDRKFVNALVAARSWVHLDLLTSEGLLEKLPNHFKAVDRTIRALLASEDSPLRTAALLHEGGDETLGCSDDESRLIDRTFGNPRWYLRCRVGYPLLMSAAEALDSGALDHRYNQNDLLYVGTQGISSRSRCRLFLAEKTIVHAIEAAIDQGLDDDFYVTDLWDLFRDIYDHSRFEERTWDNAIRGCREYPTPFAYLLSTISLDLRKLGEHAFRKAGFGANRPSKVVEQLATSWGVCVAHAVGGPGHTSEPFRRALALHYFNFLLERKHNLDHAAPEKSGNLAAWVQTFLEPLKTTLNLRDGATRDFLTEAVNRLDIVKPHVSACHQWLRDELALPPRPIPRN